MKTLFTIPTQAGEGTLPGGIVLRDKGAGEHNRFVTHDYSVMEGRTGYHCGGYYDTLSEALADLAKRVERAERYPDGIGGALDLS